jgi:P4 family phage/plasmid primase-like protien
MENNNYDILKNNDFVYFTRPKSIKTKLNKKGKEQKVLPFEKEFSWKQINRDNFKDFVNDDDKTFLIITGKMSNLTVVDFDENYIYEDLLKEYPELKDHLTVKTNKGYHIYFKYESKIKTDTDVNGLTGIDTRNDDGLIIAPPTKYKLLNNSKVGYQYLYGNLLKMPEFLLNQLIPEEPKEKPKENKKKKELIYNEDKTKEEFIERLIDLLDDSRSDDRTEWTEVSFIINNELGSEGLPLFQSFSNRSDKYEPNKDDKWFLNLSPNEKGLYVGTLMKKAKEDNPDEYKELRQEFVTSKKNESTTKDFQILEYEQDMAQYIIDKYLQDKYICVSFNPKDVFYYYNGNIWIKDDSNISLWNYITIDYVKEITEYEKTISKEDNKDECKMIKKVLKLLKGKEAGPNTIINLIGHKVFNSKFFDLCDQNIYLLGFNNGVYDSRTKEFRAGKPDDYITKSVGYDFPTEASQYKSDVEDFLKKVYPNENIRKYNLQMLANCITGSKFEDVVLTHTGRGQNGKSILQQLIRATFGEYFYEISSSYLTKQNKMEPGNPAPLYTYLNGIRIATANEPADGQKMNDSLIKIIGSKEAIQYRTLYSNVIATLNIQFVLNIFCNNKLEYNANDGGMQRRLKVIDYNSKFVKEQDYKPNNNNIYEADHKLSEKVKLWRQDFMFILLNLFDPYYKYEEPIEIVNSSKKYADDNNDINKFVKDNFIMTNDQKDFLLLKDLKLLYQSNKEYDQSKLKNLKEHLEKEFNSEFKEKAKVKINGKFVDVRSIIYGWQIIKDDDDEEKTSLDI